jgi:hypothetical protein
MTVIVLVFSQFRKLLVLKYLLIRRSFNVERRLIFDPVVCLRCPNSSSPEDPRAVVNLHLLVLKFME